MNPRLSQSEPWKHLVSLLLDASFDRVGVTEPGAEDPIIYEEGWCLPVLGLLPQSHRLHELEAHAPERERFSKVTLSIWSPKLTLQQPFNLVMTCKYIHYNHAIYAEQSASLLNQHFRQGKHSTTQWPHLTGSLNVRNPVIYNQCDCSLCLRLLPDTQRRGNGTSR